MAKVSYKPLAEKSAAIRKRLQRYARGEHKRYFQTHIELLRKHEDALRANCRAFAVPFTEQPPGKGPGRSR
jgi:hypothetical protein